VRSPGREPAKSVAKASAPVLVLIALAQAAMAAPPALFFSDLDWGPKTGWEGGAAKGAAVSIWGLNFGASRGSSYVTVNGVQLTSDSDYAEWGVTGPARDLQRITFWLRPACQDGQGTIAVTVGGVTSSTIPFLVTPGTIYYISPSGSNGNNGLTSATAWRDIFKFNPSQNSAGDGQYIVYVRGGSYSTLDDDSTFVALRGPYGGPSKRKALVGYPGETPVLNVSSAERGVVWTARYSPYGRSDYFTFAKLRMVGGTMAHTTFGDYWRIVGNSMEDMRAEGWTGVVMVDNSQQIQVLGNYFRNCGFDSYKHNIYIKTHSDYIPGDKSVDYVTVAWNEIADPYAGSDNRGGAIFISRESSSGSKYIDHIYIHSNYFHGGNMEFIYTGDSTPHNGDVWVYNNVLRENTNGAGGLFFAWGTRYAYVYNNTLYNLKGEGMLSVAGSAQVVSRNNIYRSNGTPHVTMDVSTTGSYNSQNDLFYGASIPTGARVTVSGAITGDPQFVSSSDLHIGSGSPADDSGSATVSSIVGTSYDGTSRPQGAGYDLGAFERYTGATDPVPPDLVSYALPQIAFGGAADPLQGERWTTELYFTNVGSSTADFTVYFYGNDGNPLSVPSGSGTATSIPVVVSPGATHLIQLAGANALAQGWASVLLPSSVKGTGIFRQSIDGREGQEAMVPLSVDSRQSYVMIWDDAGFDTTMAVANPGDTAVTVNFTIRAASGNQLGTGSIALGAKQKEAFLLRQRLGLPSMAGQRGTMDITISSGKVALLGLKFGKSAFTSMMPIEK